MNVEAIYPLSPQQQGMLLESLTSPEPGLFIEQESHTLYAELRQNAFEKAWRTILERHPVLRTAFVWKDQREPLQVVIFDVELPLRREDWRSLGAHEQRKRLEEYLEADRRQVFDLSKAPFMRLALFQLGQASHQFVWTQHHVVMDGWCLPVIVKEFMTLYEAFSRGVDARLEPSRPYREYVNWLRRQDLTAAETFWRKALDGITRPTSLGIELATPLSTTGGFGEERRTIPADTAARLKAVARTHQLTLSTLVHGVWAALLHLYSRDQDVVFGTTLSGRAELAGIETMVGLFITTLPLRIRVVRDQRFWPWLAEVQAKHLELRNYEYCSTGQVHRWSVVPGALPLYESVLVLENYPVDASIQAVETGNGSVSHFSGARTKHALTILITPAIELSIRVIHNRRRVGDAAAAAIANHLVAMLQSAALSTEGTVEALLRTVPAEQIPRVIPAMNIAGNLGENRAGEDRWPKTATEETLVRIAAELLGVNTVSVRDNILALGGHSLLIMQFASRVREAFGVELPLRVVFEASTIEKLAANVSTLQWASKGANVTIPAAGSDMEEGEL